MLFKVGALIDKNLKWVWLEHILLIITKRIWNDNSLYMYNNNSHANKL